MRAAALSLSIFSLALSAIAHARPEQGWREQPRSGESAASQHRAPAEPRRPVLPLTQAMPSAPRPQAAPPAPPAFGTGSQRAPLGLPRWPGSTGVASGAIRWNDDVRRNDDFRNDGWRRDDFRRDDRRRDDWRQQRYRYDNGRYFSRTRYNVGLFFWPRGYATRTWLIGEGLPSAFYDDDRYLLPQYSDFQLYSPPYGCRWVRVGSDALLIDRFGGEVLDIVYGLFW